MNETEQKFFHSFYKQMDFITDNLDLIVLQNRPEEPVLEVLIKLEGNTLPADIQNSLGQVQPNWNADRYRYTANGDLLYRKDETGRVLYGQTIKSRPGLPKNHLPIYGAQERMHTINAVSHMETEDESKKEIYIRIIKPKCAGQRAKLWAKRKEQIKHHVMEEEDVRKQLDKEKQAFLNPLQTKSDNKFGAPKYKSLMPEEYNRWMAEKAKADLPNQQFAEKFENSVKTNFQELEKTMLQVRLPTIHGIKYHTGLGQEGFEQPEQPGLATMNKANYDRFMRVMTQLEPHGDFTEEEENQIDEDENQYLVATETGQIVLSNDLHFINRNRRHFRRDHSDEGTIVAQSIPSLEGSQQTEANRKGWNIKHYSKISTHHNSWQNNKIKI